MKHTLTLLYISVLAVLALGSCDEVDMADRLVYIEPAEAKRAILIEDFTGQNCVNCPYATEAIEELQATYGADNVIAVGIHSGPFAHVGSNMGAAYMPLGTKQGDEYYAHWGIEAQPGMFVNRVGGGVLYDTDLLLAAVPTLLDQDTPLNLSVETTFDDSSRQLTATVTGFTSDPVSGKLQVYITEDGITDTQLMPDGSENTAYVHNHVFRASMTADAYGDPFSLAEGESKTASYSYTVPSDWDSSNIAIVAFVYNDNGCVQVVRQPLTGDEAEEEE